MKYIYFSFFFTISFFGQTPIDNVLKKYNKKTVPYITVSELKNKKDIILLDSREQKEYNVSHLKKALYVGYDHFDSKKTIANLKNYTDTIVVYCSLGVRSENIATQLKKLGYKNVYNLYGGIFEWKNQGLEVEDNNHQTTDKVHAFSKEWGKYLLKGKKIY